MNIEAVDQHTAPEDVLRAMYDLTVAEYTELSPEDPIMPWDEWLTMVRSPVSWSRSDRWVAWDESRSALLAQAGLFLSFTETNRDQAGAAVYVRADSRGQGIGRALLRELVARAEDEGRVLLNSGGITDSPATTFCEHLGGERKITERKSRMVLAEVDRPMLEDWVVKAKERAEGYSLLAWYGPVPDEYLDKFVALTMVMNTAPRDDLVQEDWIHTPERHREGEQRAIKNGQTWWTLVARHDATDELVGYTELYFPSFTEEIAWQEATAVDPVHRDKGLGRLLKATNALRLLDEKPAVRYVDTWNAFSNAPMLGINIAMGFEVVKSFSEYQLPTATVRERLG
jgi:GNAT superfamily N-acetyltransferase